MSTPNQSELLAPILLRLQTERAEWAAWIADRADDQHVSLSGQPFVVAVGGLGLYLNGTTATPTTMRPGLCGISHFTRADAETVVRLRGAPYTVVAARDVPALRLADLDGAIAELARLVG